ncbi:hypothetical protein C8N24_0720 [Solirubrobacter pauli]|uniref:PD-(D/E)XK nuclease superfamily protein n=1 Tax=Solirubrobacter pauli TaxID=166793 RepID=A0A660L9H0_9ACTN|nr:hypothetical protein C8N24_0720 [Solirubrobacter pauli]
MIDTALALIEAPKGATEPRLTACMTEVLAADPHAAAEFARALLRVAPNDTARDRLGPVPPRLTTRGEHRFTAGGRLSRRDRRADLSLTADDSWGLIVEAKLDAPFSKGQLEDSLRAGPAAFDLASEASMAVLALTSNVHAFGRFKDPDRRWLGIVLWHDVLADLFALEFDDPELTVRWQQLLSVYTRRERFGKLGAVRPAPRTQLEFAAERARRHIETRLGTPVELRGNRSGRVVQGGARTGWVQYGFRAKGQKCVLTVESLRPKQRPRALVIREDPGDVRLEFARFPAELLAFEDALHEALDVFLAHDGRAPRQ